MRLVRQGAVPAVWRGHQPENVEWWFENITTAGGVTDFDIIGFSYYSPWSSEPLSSIAGHVSRWRQSYDQVVHGHGEGVSVDDAERGRIREHLRTDQPGRRLPRDPCGAAGVHDRPGSAGDQRGRYDTELAPFPEDAEGGPRKAFLEAVNETLLGISSRRVKGIFWWEPASGCGRDYFDAACNALPVITVFDRFMRN